MPFFYTMIVTTDGLTRRMRRAYSYMTTGRLLLTLASCSSRLRRSGVGGGVEVFGGRSTASCEFPSCPDGPIDRVHSRQNIGSGPSERRSRLLGGTAALFDQTFHSQTNSATRFIITASQHPAQQADGYFVNTIRRSYQGGRLLSKIEIGIDKP